MDNKILMSILAQLQKTHTQRQTLYIMGGIIIMGGISIYYLKKNNNAQSYNIKSLTGINGTLTAHVGKQEQVLSQKQGKINQLEIDNQQLSQTIASLRQEKPQEN